MTSIKGLAIIALLVGGTSLAIAQSGPPTGGQPPVAGGAAGNPAAPGPPGPGVIPHDARPGLQAAAPATAPATTTSTRTRVAHRPTNRRMYMQGDVHRGSKVTGSALSTHKLRHNQNSYK